MAAALQPLRNDNGLNTLSLYPRSIMADFDFNDNRYPPLSSTQTPSDQRSPPGRSSVDPISWEDANNDLLASRRNHGLRERSPGRDRSTDLEPAYAIQPPQRSSGPSPDLLSVQSQSQQSQEPPRTSLSYALPPGASRRVVERYSLNESRTFPSRDSRDAHQTLVDSTPEPPRVTPQARSTPPQDRPTSVLQGTPRHPAAPASNMTTIATAPADEQLPSFMPLAASPSYNPPVAPNYRAYAQQPTYINPPTAPNPVNTVYSPMPPQPQEEVCIECAMRDRDMADVDVTSPGVWERSSDVFFEELKQRELEDEANGVTTIDDPSRPRVKGGRLTEQNIKIWLSINPREPASKQQTLNSYVKSQRALLEAEAAAHAKAMQEAKQLDNRMRDAYSQLRRSAYDTGSSASPADDSGGVRIKPPTSTQYNSHTRSHSREITLLQNGMIVEHVDVRKEEREARERKRKEEKRTRKSSRSSGIDVTSVISAQSYGSPLENGLRPYSRYSQSGSIRPTSVLTSTERPDLPRAYSQASFSDVHSMGSASPRRSRFFGFRNLSTGWRSQDSLAVSGMSGSMVDMHVALQREGGQGLRPMVSSPVDMNATRRSQFWPPVDVPGTDTQSDATEEKPRKKKKKGLAKIWSIVTGSGKDEYSVDVDSSTVTRERPDDDLPLTPPPPLSYLVARGPSNVPRHGSTPSLPSTSPRGGVSSPGMSPPTAPSSVLPSPTSSRPNGPDVDVVEFSNITEGFQDFTEMRQRQDDTIGKNDSFSRQAAQQAGSEPGSLLQAPPTSNRPMSLFSREKSLPPLPPGELPPPNHVMGDGRPRTVHTYDARTLPLGSGAPHDFLPSPKAPFRTNDARRQSFGGMASRPPVPAPTTPQTGSYDARALGPRYDEFGHSRRSLGKLEFVQEDTPAYNPVTPTAKRKSRFGLSSLLGKKHTKEPIIAYDGVNSPTVHQFPSTMHSSSDGQDDLTINGYATSTSRHSALSSGAMNYNTRMSVTSRKALEELVSQDADFVAYRYPSNDQRLDLLR